MISPMNWGGRTRTYNFLINSPFGHRTAVEPLGSDRGKLPPSIDSSGTARSVSSTASPRTFPRTFRASLRDERQRTEKGSLIGASRCGFGGAA